MAFCDILLWCWNLRGASDNTSDSDTTVIHTLPVCKILLMFLKEVSTVAERAQRPANEENACK